jgi:small subunit ribosomal protein S10
MPSFLFSASNANKLKKLTPNSSPMSDDKKPAAKKPAAKKPAAEKAPKKAPVAKKAAAPKKESILAPEKGKKETKKATASDKQKIRVIIRAFDHKIVDESSKTIIDTAERTGSLVTGPIPLPTKIERVTVNRSTFVNKDAREQFEIRTHKRLIDITEYTSTTIDSLSNLNLPAGVDVEIKMM